MENVSQQRLRLVKNRCFTIVVLLLAWAGSASAQPSVRLDDSSSAVAYRATVTVDPNQTRFEAEIAIDIKVHRPIAVLWLNARELEIRRAELQNAAGPRPVKVVTGGRDFVGFEFGQPIAPGEIRLLVLYAGNVHSERSVGLFRQRDSGKGEWYAFTQFAPAEARRVFPCYDEPAFRAPWQITLRVPSGMPAFSNTPLVDRRAENGFDRVEFRPTRPLPSYLVAFAAGPFETISARPAGRKSIPVRIIVPVGRSGQVRKAAEITPDVLERLEEYTGSPYPFEKLDSIALPQARFAAMENPGLVVYRQGILTGDPKNYERICAHELAHQWFGNLVTMRWWIDIWLSEGLSTWLANKVMKEDVRTVLEIGNTMLADEGPNSRRVREPVTSVDGLMRIYNQFTYTKAAAITGMFEEWIGENVFRRAMQQYLARYAWQSVATEEFLATVSDVFGRDVAPAWQSFLDQTGVPLLDARLDCASTPRRVAVEQKPAQWTLPYCFRSSTGGACAVIDPPAASVPMGPSCPSWLIPNANGSGYYRVDPDPEILARLRRNAASELKDAERAALARDIPVLAGRGALPLHEALLLVPLLARKDLPLVTERLVRWLARVRRALPDAESAELVRYLERAVNAGASDRLLEVGTAAADLSLRPRAEEVALDAGASPEEAVRLLVRSGSYEFVTRNYIELSERLPAASLAELPRTASSYCDDDKAREVEAFFKGRAGQRQAGSVAAEIRACAQLRRAQAPLDGVVPRE